jgi:hypothetical protein
MCERSVPPHYATMSFPYPKDQILNVEYVTVSWGYPSQIPKTYEFFKDRILVHVSMSTLNALGGISNVKCF